LINSDSCLIEKDIKNVYNFPLPLHGTYLRKSYNLSFDAVEDITGSVRNITYIVFNPVFAGPEKIQPVMAMV